MDKEMTLRDFVTEAEVFQHSKTYYDMIKEAGEIELMAIYIEADQFISENPELLTEQVEMVSTMFGEATTTEDKASQVDAVKKSFGSKVKSALLKVLSFIMKPFKALWKMITTVYNNSMKSIKNKMSLKDLETRLNGIEVTDENKELVQKIVGNIISVRKDQLDKNVNIKDKFKDPDASKIIKSLKKFNVDDETLGKIKNLIAASSYNPTIRVPAITTEIVHIGLAIVNPLHALLITLQDQKTTTKEAIVKKILISIKKIETEIDNLYETKDITIPFNTMPDIIEGLTKINKDLGEKLEELTRILNSTSEILGDSGNILLGNIIKSLTELNAKFNKCTAQAIMDLNDTIKIRENNLNIVSEMINAITNSKTTEKAKA